MFETERWPFVPARDFTKVTGKRYVRLIVIHDMEFPERDNSAEAVAAYFQHPDTPSSAHICVDNNSIVQCVHDNDVAWAAPGANSDGIQVELTGYAKQGRGEWLDHYGVDLINRAGDAVAQYCLKYNIPPIQLLNREIVAGHKGIVGHRQISQVYRRSDHMDPGPNFPWDVFLEVVRDRVAFHSNNP